jgi:opacity protein-like surface antigen
MVMMKRQWLQRFLAGAGLLALTAASAGAQVVQVSSSDARNSIGFTFGGFFLRGDESRDADDVLLADSFDLASFHRPDEPLGVKDFQHITFGGEYLFRATDFLEAGVSAGYYKRSVPTFYRDLVNTNGSEIEQRLSLKIVPVTATVRFLPLGRAPVEPYVGAGVGIFKWNYREVGDFVDFTDNNNIFTNDYRTDGTAVGPVILAGVRFPVGDVLAAGGEVRWQKATGDTGGIDQGFLGDKIDLGGVTASFTIHFRF